MSDIFDEVSEELKRDNMTEFWNSYKYAVYGAAALIVAGVGSFSGYKEYMSDVQRDNSAIFDQGVEGLKDGNIATLKKVIFEGDTGYATLSAMKLAQFHIEKGNYSDASQALQPVMKNKNPPYSNLATILYALYSDEDATAMAKLVKPETESGKPFRHQALMVAAELSLRAGNDADAKSYLQTLTADTTAPTSTMVLARQILGTIQ